jgi:hypothetical protein
MVSRGVAVAVQVNCLVTFAGGRVVEAFFRLGALLHTAVAEAVPHVWGEGHVQVIGQAELADCRSDDVLNGFTPRP